MAKMGVCCQCTEMAASIVDLFIHHHGSFSEPDLEYVGGDVMVVEGLDACSLCFGDIDTILEVYLEYNYHDIPRLRLYYKYDDESNDYIRGLTKDKDIMNMFKEVASGKKNRLHIFVNDAIVEEVPFEVGSPVMIISQSPTEVYAEEPAEEPPQEHVQEHLAAKVQAANQKEQLNDSVLKGSHPYTDYLKEKSGLAYTNAGDRILTDNGNHNAVTWRVNGSCFDAQHMGAKGNFMPRLLENGASSSSQSIEENSVLVHGTELLEHLSESDIPVVQQEGCNLAKDQIGTMEEGRGTVDVNDEYTASMRCGYSSDDELHRIQSEIPADSATMMHPDTCGDEPHQSISVDEVKDDSEHCAILPCRATMMVQDTSVDEPCRKNSIDEVRDGSEQRAEPRTSSGPLLEKTRENESQCNFEHDVLLKAPHAASLDGDCEAGTSSDSDGCHKDHIDISMKKHEFLSSQCTNLCVKCNEGGQLLVCNTSHCPLVVHEICLGSSPRFDNNGNFYCRFCAYSLAISEYLEAKKKSSLARKELTKFVRGGLEHQKKEVLERLHREKQSLSRQNEYEDPLVKSHESRYSEERVNDQTEDTSEDGKNKSFISNYSIGIRRQLETH
jgi:hypothetical protein